MNVQCLEFLMLGSPAQQLLWTLVFKTSIFISYRSGCSFIFPFLSVFILCLIPYLHFWTWLYTTTVLSQRLYTIKPELAVNWLTHSIHCSSTVFQYQVLHKTLAQVIWIGFVSLHDISSLNIHSVEVSFQFVLMLSFCLAFTEEIVKWVKWKMSWQITFGFCY